MSRHGQCRCGATLTFRQRDGYKTRCSKCGKIVRLQVSESSPVEPEPPFVQPVEPDAGEALEPGPVEEAFVVEEDEAAPLVVLAEESAARTELEAASDPHWTWQWLAVASGLAAWEGILSILAWLWWQ
jgi:hypothetical protein